MENLEESSINVIKPKEKDINYTKRKAAYVIVEQEDGKIAILKHNETFLIGGGIEPGENEEETIRRECIEETGYTLKNIKPFDIVKSYEFNKKYGNLEIEATIYTAEFDNKVRESIEHNEIIICYPEEYKNNLYHEYQRYVLRKYINQKGKKSNAK